MNQTDLDPDLDSGSKLGTATKAKDKAGSMRSSRAGSTRMSTADPQLLPAL